jgi:predicted ATP-dependent endonuclease of OLD family
MERVTNKGDIMYLKYIQIVNFKNLKAARFEFAKGANTIIGENDSGKSNALTAIRILLDDNYYYNTKRLKETDFSYALGDWRGHWIIISAFFDEISREDKSNEFCAELTPEQENIDFLKSYIRCADKEFGTVSLFIRPCRAKRAELAEAAQNGTFEAVRSQIKLSDYEFYYTSRSQADFTDENVYKSIVGDICAGQYVNPEDDDQSVLGSKIDIMNVWQHISTVFIDALRDVESELRKPKNPIRQIIDTIEGNIEETDIDDIKRKISELNQKISHIPQVSDIGSQVNQKLLEMIGAIYSPEIKLESRLKEDFATLARYLTISPSNQKDIDLLGLGHLNILYIAMKLVEFEVNRNRELLNIMIIEEPEAHIHTHIQKTLFNNLQVTHTYTQVVMSTHSTHLSEVSDIEKVNVMKKVDEQTSLVMKPTNGLDQFGADVLEYKGISFSKILSRYLDAKRSVLLFSKGVIMVEGDGEEILIPALVKKVLGVSLDEMGIGLINIGSVGFENVACIFDESRLQRKCSIVTDLDVVVDGAKKSSQVAMDRGASRREKLSRLFDANPYVSAFYAPHTLEVDFASEDNNKRFVCAIIKRAYKDAATKEKHVLAVKSGTEAERYDSVMTVAKNIKKGWYATLLAEKIDAGATIPMYILDAIAFVAKDILSEKLLWKMTSHSFNAYDLDEDYDDLKTAFKEARSSKEIRETIEMFCDEFPNDMVSSFIAKAGGLSV